MWLCFLQSGILISQFLNCPGGDLQKSLAKIGIEALLDMVRIVTAMCVSYLLCCVAFVVLCLKLFVHNFVHGDLHPGNILVQTCDDPKLVLLDCGIATSLGPADWENLHCVFMAIVRNEGDKIADLFLNNQQCSTLQEYRRKMTDIVDRAVSNLNLEKVWEFHNAIYT